MTVQIKNHSTNRLSYATLLICKHNIIIFYFIFCQA